MLDLALTHASVGEGAERGARGRPFADNQRLEFLGDRLLGLLVAVTDVRPGEPGVGYSCRLT